MHSMRASSSRHQIQQILEIAVISKGEINHLLAVYLGAHVGSVRLKYRGFSSYYHTFAYGPRIKREVHSSVSVHNYIHSRSHGFLESLFLGDDFIKTWGEIGECIIPAIISRGTAADSRLHFRGSHLRPGYECSAGIRHRSEQRCINRLPHDWCRKPQEYCPEQHGHAQTPQFDHDGCGRRHKSFGIHYMRTINAAHPWDGRTKQFFHDITPLDSRRLA